MCTQELRARVQGLRYLIIDEISMVSATTLLHLHRRLEKGTGVHAAYSGVSVLFIGDFFQLPRGEELQLVVRLTWQEVEFSHVNVTL